MAAERQRGLVDKTAVRQLASAGRQEQLVELETAAQLGCQLAEQLAMHILLAEQLLRLLAGR